MCNLQKKILNSVDIEKCQKELDRLWDCAVENVMKINPSKYKAIRLTRACVKNQQIFSLMGTLIQEASS